MQLLPIKLNEARVAKLPLCINEEVGREGEEAKRKEARSGRELPRFPIRRRSRLLCLAFPEGSLAEFAPGAKENGGDSSFSSGGVFLFYLPLHRHATPILRSTEPNIFPAT